MYVPTYYYTDVSIFFIVSRYNFIYIIHIILIHTTKRNENQSRLSLNNIIRQRKRVHGALSYIRTAVKKYTRIIVRVYNIVIVHRGAPDTNRREPVESVGI